MGVIGKALIAILCAGPCLAQTYSCSGSNPEWTLEITDTTGTFSMADVVMDIPQSTTAKDRDWPKAITLFGGRDTAIVILNERVCSTEQITNYPIEANVLTQTGETPVILTGCCTIP